MLLQRQIIHSAPRFTAQLRSPAVRSMVQRRLASSSPAQPGENAFIRERRAVKEHAAATTGEIAHLSINACLSLANTYPTQHRALAQDFHLVWRPQFLICVVCVE